VGVITRGSPTSGAYLGWGRWGSHWLILGPTLGILTYLSRSQDEWEPWCAVLSN
jgi:hypothetical protein